MPKCTQKHNELKTIVTEMTTDIMSENPTGEAIDKLCRHVTVMEECFDETMDLVKMCLRGDETIFNRDGIKPIKRFLEHMCKDEGLEIKSMLMNLSYFKTKFYI